MSFSFFNLSNLTSTSFTIPNIAICLRLNICRLTLQFEEVGAFLVHIRPLGLENLVETLALKAAARHREVDKCNTRTQIWRELNLHARATTN